MIDPAEAERRMLAQVGARRALASDVVRRLIGDVRGGIRRRSPLELPSSALLAWIRPSLQLATYVRRETVDQGQVERFWLRRALPHQAMLARRRPAPRTVPSRPPFVPPVLPDLPVAVEPPG